MANFAVIGVAGYIAPRHLEAIRENGGTVIAAVDPSDSVGILDRYGYDIHYINSMAYLSDLPLDYVSICSPNHCHKDHIKAGLDLGADVICEKPLVTHKDDLNDLYELEQASGHKINAVLQLRLHPEIIRLKAELDPARRYSVAVNYHTPRGNWYGHSWKGQPKLSGGLLFNIGIHLFDLLLDLFGPYEDYQVERRGNVHSSGWLTLERADVLWSLATCPEHGYRREMVIEGQAVDVTGGFDKLHNEVYRRILAGQGFGLEQAKGAIELCHALRAN